MFRHTPLKVSGNASIQCVVGALEDVEIIHSLVTLAYNEKCFFGSPLTIVRIYLSLGVVLKTLTNSDGGSRAPA